MSFPTFILLSPKKMNKTFSEDGPRFLQNPKIAIPDVWECTNKTEFLIENVKIKLVKFTTLYLVF